MFRRFMEKVVALLDPKLEKYRSTKQAYKPTTLAEFVKLLRRTPQTVLSTSDRERIASIMGFEGRKVRDLMIKKPDMVFVHEKDFLGPLMLDKLYKSGFTHFPVVDQADHLLGTIHTEALNTLEIKKTDRAMKYLDKNVHYLHENDSLRFMVMEINRTNHFYFFVLNDKEELTGFLTLEILLNYLVG